MSQNERKIMKTDKTDEKEIKNRKKIFGACCVVSCSCEIANRNDAR